MEMSDMYPSSNRGWTSIKKQWPSIGLRVQVHYGGSSWEIGQLVGSYDDPTWLDDDSKEIFGVTHWAYRPYSPSGEAPLVNFVYSNIVDRCYSCMKYRDDPLFIGSLCCIHPEISSVHFVDWSMSHGCSRHAPNEGVV